MEDISIKKIFEALSKPFKFIIGGSLTVTGLSATSLIFFISTFVDNLKDEKNNEKLFYWIFALISVILISMTVLAFLSTIALIRLKFNNNKLSNCSETCGKTSDSFFEQTQRCTACVDKLCNDISISSEDIKNSVEILNSEITSFSLAKYILNEKRINNLEASAPEGARIVVMTSKYELDKNKLMRIILDNIRKGVVYEYLVSGNRKDYSKFNDHRNFCKVYKKWWNSFKSDLYSKNFIPTEGMQYSNKYIELKTAAISAKNEKEKELVTIKAKEYFKDHVCEYFIGKEHSLVTIIMYQQEADPSSKWKVIMKLPTVSNGNYYAFQIPDEEAQEKANLINKIDAICVEQNAIKLDV